MCTNGLSEHYCIKNYVYFWTQVVAFLQWYKKYCCAIQLCFIMHIMKANQAYYTLFIIHASISGVATLYAKICCRRKDGLINWHFFGRAMMLFLFVSCSAYGAIRRLVSMKLYIAKINLETVDVLSTWSSTLYKDL